jgi:hypothetical protein
VVKIVTEMLGETLGNEEDKARARKAQTWRKLKSKVWKPKMENDNKVDSSVLPEHFAYLDSMRGKGSVSIIPVITPGNPKSRYKATQPRDYTQDMMATTPEGNAQYARYQGTLRDSRETVGPILNWSPGSWRWNPGSTERSPSHAKLAGSG